VSAGKPFFGRKAKEIGHPGRRGRKGSGHSSGGGQQGGGHTHVGGRAEAILKVQKAMAEGVKMLNDANATKQVIALRSLEAFAKAADGKATKIIVRATSRLSRAWPAP
jgi:regulator of protease activity HflC (stomatin/prohibitin superfamily)